MARIRKWYPSPQQAPTAMAMHDFRIIDASYVEILAYVAR
jgi:hypothetical protein